MALVQLLFSLLSLCRNVCRGLYRAAWRVAKSKKTHTAVISTGLALVAAVLLYVPAVLSYLFFYYKYLPEQAMTIPMYLQYGFGPNPFAIASLASPKQLHLRQPYDVSVSLSLPRSPANLDRGNFMIALHLLAPSSSPPDPSANQLQYITPLPDPDARPGAFPVLAHVQPTRLDVAAFLSTNTILHTSTRPAIIPYADPLDSLAARLIRAPYHALFPHSAATAHLTVPMVEKLTFSPPSYASSLMWGGKTPVRQQQKLLRQLPESLLLEVQAGQDLRVYEASVVFSARLGGLRWFMYRWRVTAFLLLTWAFWACEVAVMVVAMVVFAWLWSGTERWLEWGGSEDGEGRKDEGKDKDAEGEGESAQWSTTDSPIKTETSSVEEAGKEPEVKKEEEKEEEVEVKKEEEEAEGLSGMPEASSSVSQGAEADDEAEGEGETSKKKWKGKGKAIYREEPAREEEMMMMMMEEVEEEEDDDDLGIGTSYSRQARKGGTRRRNIAGRSGESSAFD